MTETGDGQHLAENLDALARDIEDLEKLAATALNDEPAGPELIERVQAEPGSLDYQALTAHNRNRRKELDWGDVDLPALLSGEQRAALSCWTVQDRIRWTPDDFLIVGFAGATGVLAAAFDTRADSLVRDGLGWLKTTELMQRWEAEAKRMPIDYTGPKFGGPAHRVRSPGHDVLRFVNALHQVRTGTFTGMFWQDKRKITVHRSTNNYGKAFATTTDPLEATALLLKHWAADVITPLSLPLPGFSLLTELPVREVRAFANRAYAGLEFGGPGTGMNIRSSMATPALSVFAVEVLIRSHVHLQTYRSSGGFELAPRMRRKRIEMLLAAHSLSSAASLTKTAAKVSAYGPLALRHVNVRTLVRTGSLALELQRHRASTSGADPAWQLLAEEELSGLDEAELERFAGLLESSAAD